MPELYAAVLAAGKGTRMKSALPKVCHPLFGKALVVRVIESLQSACGNRLRAIYPVVGYGREAVETSLTSLAPSHGIEPVYQPEQLGTGDALKHVVSHCQKAAQTPAADDVLIVLSGDVPLLRPETITALVDTHLKGQAAVTVLAATLENPTGYGRLVRGNAGALEAIVEEKDATEQQRAVTEINSGVYAFRWGLLTELLDELKPNNAQGEYYLTDAVRLALTRQQQVQTLHCPDATEILGINTLAQLAECQQVLNQRQLSQLMAAGVSIIDPQATWISPEVSIGAGSVIYPGCYFEGDIAIGQHNRLGPHTVIEGEVCVGDHCQIRQSQLTGPVAVGNQVRIGPFAHLRQSVVLANDTRIGNFVELKQASVGEGSNAAHLSYIGDAELGEGVNIGAGTIVANYDPIRKVKSKTILEDGASIGSNSVLVAPLTVETNASVAAGTVVTGDVPAEALAIGRAPLEVKKDWVSRKKATNSSRKK